MVLRAAAAAGHRLGHAPAHFDQQPAPLQEANRAAHPEKGDAKQRQRRRIRAPPRAAAAVGCSDLLARPNREARRGAAAAAAARPLQPEQATGAAPRRGGGGGDGGRIGLDLSLSRGAASLGVGGLGVEAGWLGGRRCSNYYSLIPLQPRC